MKDLTRLKVIWWWIVIFFCFSRPKSHSLAISAVSLWDLTEASLKRGAVMVFRSLPGDYLGCSLRLADSPFDGSVRARTAKEFQATSSWRLLFHFQSQPSRLHPRSNRTRPAALRRSCLWRLSHVSDAVIISMIHGPHERAHWCHLASNQPNVTGTYFYFALEQRRPYGPDH